MTKSKILDCTLRDGGYVNDWNFGCENIDKIISGLIQSKIDCIECGFLSKKSTFNEDKTLFRKLSDFRNNYNFSNFTFMVNMGDYDLNDTEIFSHDYELRIAFKPYQLNEICDYLRPITENNKKFSLNPMHISLYSEKDLQLLCDITNRLRPACLTGVDTMGIMTNSDTEKIFKHLHNNIDTEIPIGFHSHNNLNLSFENTKIFISVIGERTFYIDSCLGGLARGGGMLETETIAEYFNDKFFKNYDLSLLNTLNKDVISKIRSEHNFQERYPYYLSAKNKCHPNYAKFLIENNYDIESTNKILKSIPNEFKPYYNENTIIKTIKEQTT